MVDRFDIKDHMEVVGADGVPLGRVDDVETGRIKLARQGSPDGEHHWIALNKVERVEGGRVHLYDSAAVALGGFGAKVAEAVGDPVDSHANVIAGDRPGRNYLLWALLAVALLAVLGGMYAWTKAKEREHLLSPPKQEQGPVSPVGPR